MFDSEMFPDSLEKAIEIQNEIRERIVLKPLDVEKVNIVAGVDLSYIGNVGLCVIVVINKDLELLEVVYDKQEVTFPYVPGFLVFREGPVFLKTYQKLKVEPDVIIFDGQGIAHPRGIGIASHIGVVMGKPTVGVAKRRLYGHYEFSKSENICELFDNNNRKIGYVVKNNPKYSPIFISPGHLCDPDSALAVVQRFTTKYKLPEPTRLAHKYSQKLRKEFF